MLCSFTIQTNHWQSNGIRASIDWNAITKHKKHLFIWYTIEAEFQHKYISMSIVKRTNWLNKSRRHFHCCCCYWWVMLCHSCAASEMRNKLVSEYKTKETEINDIFWHVSLDDLLLFGRWIVRCKINKVHVHSTRMTKQYPYLNCFQFVRVRFTQIGFQSL